MRIKEIRMKRRSAYVILEENTVFYFPSESWQEHETLSVEDEVDPDSLTAWLYPRQYPEALGYAVSLLAQRDRSSGEIRTKLNARSYLPDTVDMVLYKLEQERLLDDALFARKWASARSRAQIGKTRIRRELLQKGITRDLADSALAELDKDESEDAASALAEKLLKRYASETDSSKAMNKLMGAMARRGYSYEDTRRAVENAIAVLRDEGGFDSNP